MTTSTNTKNTGIDDFDLFDEIFTSPIDNDRITEIKKAIEDLQVLAVAQKKRLVDKHKAFEDELEKIEKGENPTRTLTFAEEAAQRANADAKNPGNGILNKVRNVKNPRHTMLVVLWTILFAGAGFVLFVILNALVNYFDVFVGIRGTAMAVVFFGLVIIGGISGFLFGTRNDKPKQPTS